MMHRDRVVEDHVIVAKEKDPVPVVVVGEVPKAVMQDHVETAIQDRVKIEGAPLILIWLGAVLLLIVWKED